MTDDANSIDVFPSKALFVDMLTKDIALDKSILDLIDNSLDGARSLRTGTEPSLEGLQIALNISENSFEITDNCGGFGIEHAKNYAFKLGRPKDAPSLKNSIGRFGIGMKRAFFKIGERIELTSTTRTERFTVIIDVPGWVEDEENWSFSFESTETGMDNPVEQTGTSIKITSLTENTKFSFGQQYFLNELGSEIESAQSVYLSRGMTILFNGVALLSEPWKILASDGFSPHSQEFDFPYDEETNIHVRILAGVTNESNPKQAGWYIFCNGRMVVEADQSSLTTWVGKDAQGEIAFPKFHNQFSKFRGYVSFDSESPHALPWNTTKTSVDIDAKSYVHTRQEMFKSARPVIDFLNALNAENDEEEDQRPLSIALNSTKASSIGQKFKAGTFANPKPRPKKNAGPKLTSISYKKPVAEVERLKDALNVSSNKEVGEASFEIAYDDQGLNE